MLEGSKSILVPVSLTGQQEYDNAQIELQDEGDEYEGEACVKEEIFYGGEGLWY